jgi:hypothetical protein
MRRFGSAGWPPSGQCGMSAVPAGLRAGEDSALRHFHSLSSDAQADTVRRLSASGMGDHELARVTKLHVEFVRRVLSERASS